MRLSKLFKKVTDSLRGQSVQSSFIKVQREYRNGELQREVIQHSENLADVPTKEMSEHADRMKERMDKMSEAMKEGPEKVFEQMDKMFEDMGDMFRR